MGKQIHRLLEADEVARLGVCAHCGPVDIVPKAGGWRCGPARRAQRESPNRSLPGRGDNRRQPHGFTGTEAAAYRAGKVCAVCGSDWNLVVDHCHATGAVRGVLCRCCNTALGMVKDDPDRLRALAVYLES